MNVIPLTLIKRISAQFTRLNETDFDQFTSANNGKVRIIGFANLKLIFKDRVIRNFQAYISPNIYKNIISYQQMLEWGMVIDGFPLKKQAKFNLIKHNKLSSAQISSSRAQAPAHLAPASTSALASPSPSNKAPALSEQAQVLSAQAQPA